MSTVFDASRLDRGDRAREEGATVAAVSRGRLLALSIPAIVGLVLWRVSLLHVNVSNLGEYGLPPALPITWYAALLVSVLGAVMAITARRTSGLIAVGYIAVITIILFGTVPVLSAQPHYAWVYKHIGVVRYLEAHGKVNIKVDIYNRWPGFFALAAVYSHIAGSSNPETYASWAEPFFSFLDALLVMAAVRALTRDFRIAAGAGLIFIVTNWVGQDYYSPQAFAFVLGLALMVIVLRQLRVESGYSPRLTRLIERLGRVPQLPLEMNDAAKWPRWAAITAVLGLDAVIVASHQLTPYLLLISLGLLMLTGVVRPWWILVPMAIMTFAYFAANFSFIEHHYGVFTSVDPFNNARVSAYTQTPAPGSSFGTHAQLLLIATLWLGALCATIRLLRQGLLVRSLPFVLLAACPFGVIFGQNYGGEASLRVILFSSPWCAALVSWGLATVSRPHLKWSLMAAMAILCTAFFIPSFLGQEELNIISAAEVRASEWFYYHARRNSVLVLSASGFPYKYGGTYSEFKGPEGDANPNLLQTSSFQSKQLGPAYVPLVVDRIKEYARHGYIAFTKDETAFAEVKRVTPPGAIRSLETAVAHSPNFRLWYTNKDVQIYELVERHGAARHLAKAGRGNPLAILRLVKPAAPVGKDILLWQSPGAGFERNHRRRVARRSPHARSPKRSR